MRTMDRVDIFEDAMSKLGSDIAAQAARHEQEAQEAWERVRTLFSLAQALGAAQMAYDMLFSAGDKTLAKKAIWYRRQKRLLAAAIDQGITVSDKMDMKALEEAVTRNRRESRTPEERQADAMRMVARTTKGALSAGAGTDNVTKALLRAITPYKHH